MKQADIWYFGEMAGIDFRSGKPVPLTGKDTMVSMKSSAVISDSLGNLLFFTDGKRVWNRNFAQMYMANALEGDLGATQPVLIVPAPSHPDKYYIFTIDVLKFDSDSTFSTNGLKYTVIDMTLWGNRGDAKDTMNFPLLDPVCQKLTAVKHRNRADYWVITHEWNSSSFFAYLITSSGISYPVISEAGTFTGGSIKDQGNAAGYMKASPDGTYIALAISGLNKIELYDFDDSTGMISNPRSVTTADPGISPYGIEFSPDSRKLYSSLLQLTGSGVPENPSKIYQFDLSAGLNDPVLIATNHGIRSGGMQLASDGRIYIARTVNLLTKRDSLDVIYNPTRPGTECNFNFLDSLSNRRLSLKGRKSTYGLPSFIQSYFNHPVFTYDSICFRDTIQFKVWNRANIDSLMWDFGDGTTSSDTAPSHYYSGFGTYNVKLVERFNGKSFETDAPVNILELPSLGFADTVLLYPESSVNIHAGSGYPNYSWFYDASDSVISRDSVINVVKEGSYRVRVRDRNCCFATDTVYVKSFKYYAPNAFTPDGDGRNDVFRIVGLNKDVNMTMEIYNSRSNLLFTSDNIEQGWNGTLNGTPLATGTYIWIAKIRFLSNDVITSGEIVLKGTVLLLR